MDSTAVERPPQQLSDEIVDDSMPKTVQGGSAIVKPIISPTEAEIRKRDEIIYYTVEEDDNIRYISKIFGVSVNTILWANNLTNYSIIRPGDKLKILPTSGLLHKVVKNDTLTKLAKKYDGWFRLASHLHMPLRACMQAHTHREYLAWQAWLEEEWNTPTRTD